MTVVEQDRAGERSVPWRRYGTWRSPLTPGAVAADAGGPSWPAIVGPEAWWCASHPPTGTIRLLRCAADGATADVLGGDWRVANGAIGYGGRPYLAVAGASRHLVVFTHARDGRLYRAHVAPLPAGPRAPEPSPIPLTPPDAEGFETCYADPILGPGGDEVWCVREVVRGGVSTEVSRAVVAIPLSGRACTDAAAIRVVADTHDFYSGIRLSPDGARLSWVGWNHPDLPWDSSFLMVARLAGGRARDAVRVLGGDGVSVPQAEWAGPDCLYAMADPEGWWNLHRVTLEPGGGVRAQCVLPMESECSHPIWRVGTTSFAVTEPGVVLRHGVGDQRLALWEPRTGTLVELAGAESGLTEFAVGLGGAADVAAIAAGPAERAHPVRIEAASRRVRRCAPAADDGFGPWHARPGRRTALRPDNRPVHYLYYPPTHPDHTAAHRSGGCPAVSCRR